MKKTRLFALALAGMMTLGSATPTFAAEEGTPVGFTIEPPCVEYSMTIPAGNTNVAPNGAFSSIGSLTVVKKDANFDAKHKLEVTVSHGTEMVKTGATSSATTAITYDLYTGEAKVDENKVADGDKIEFSAEDINAESGKSVAMGVALSGTNFDSLVPGDYRDTITFAAAAKAAATPVTYERTGKTALSSENLGTPTSWTYSGTTYQVYNAFIPSSSGSSWNDAMGFVAALNDAKFDGHEDWTLLSSEAMAKAYVASGTGAMPDSSALGSVDYLWSSVELNSSEAYDVACNGGNWFYDLKSDSFGYGFVVLQGSSNKVTIEGVEIVAEDGESWSTIVSNNEGLLKTERALDDGREYVKIKVDGSWEELWTNRSTRVKPSDTFSTEKTYGIPF